jgi:peroxisomal coenzyme A diphosphatase NUDT7
MNLEHIHKQLESRTRKILGSENFGQFSVLLPLIEKEGETHVLFEVRSQQLRRQPGEICFPGGRMDEEDIDDRYTAIRETTEELGITRNNIQQVFPLDYIVTAFGTIIYPYVGFIVEPERIKPNPSEVAEVFTVPISYFQTTEPDCYKINFNIQPEPNFPFELIEGGENYNWTARKVDEYFYHYKGRVIWGLTARILTHFLELIKNKS